MFKRRKNDRRSPLRAPPLRTPGQSLDEEMQRLLDDKLVGYFMVAGTFFVLTFMEWWRWYFERPPRPMLLTVITVAILIFVGWKLAGLRQRFRLLRQGRDGERAVGQFLERLREDGYRVLHDLVGEGFNVDHVLIGPAGVFAIETKTISKPARGPAEIVYDGNQVLIDGFAPERDPIVQGKAQARWLRELIEESTGRRCEVRAIVVYPGWFVKSDARGKWSEVLVLNPRTLPAFLAKCEHCLPAADIQLITYHLSRYIRVSGQPPGRPARA